ncbi:hypothetical protein J7L49_06525, partial [Candidatus Bathyarchaeota archaeon]|nr:hypothetical protein [Candidatus Bathyarchaeota archaeon]
ILYRAMANYLLRLNFERIGGIAANSIYLVQNHKMYTKEIIGSAGEGSYLAFRGFGPKIHAGAIPGVVYIFLETRSKFRVIVSPGSWSKWVDWPVAASRKKDTFKGLAILKKVDEEKGIAIVRCRKNEFKVHLDSIYVPASPMILRKRGVYESMLEFTQFRCESDIVKSSFDFLSKVFEKILKNGSIKLKLNEEDEAELEFRRINFNE